MEALIIQMGMIVQPSHLKKIRDNIAEQIKSGVVIIPAYAKAKVINIPDGIQVIVKPYKESENDDRL